MSQEQISTTFPAEIGERLDALGVDAALKALLLDALSGLPLASSSAGGKVVVLGAPNARAAAYVHPEYLEIDLDQAVAHRLVEWHGELKLVDAPWAGTDQLLRVRATDIPYPGVRASVLDALTGAYQANSDRPPRPTGAVRTKPAPRTRTSAPRAPRVAKPATKTSSTQSWEGVCPKCMMTHRVGVEC